MATLYIGGSKSSAIGNSAGNRTRISAQTASTSSDRTHSLAHQYLHSSPSTSSTTYSYRLRHGAPVPKYMYLNARYSDSDSYRTGRATSTITIMEFAP